MIRYLHKILNPAGYHGGNMVPFFEGWYFKLVSADEQSRYAVIPGISLTRDPANQHAFVQVMDGATGESTYHAYPVDEFWAAETGFDLRVGPNRFSLSAISINIDDPARRICGEISFGNPAPRGWDVRLLSPGIMGWYAWVPRMECYHGVLSFDHGLHGQLEISGQATDFTGGRGYIEKDWGRAFPEAWIWFQTNHFGSQGTCLTASMAVIPWLKTAFPGFIVGVWHGGKLYRFATYTGAQVTRLEIGEEVLSWNLEDRHRRLEMVAHRRQGGLLQAPTLAGMDRRITETMDARIWLRLSEGEGSQWKTILEEEGRNAGLEAVGELARLQALLRK